MFRFGRTAIGVVTVAAAFLGLAGNVPTAHADPDPYFTEYVVRTGSNPSMFAYIDSFVENRNTRKTTLKRTIQDNSATSAVLYESIIVANRIMIDVIDREGQDELFQRISYYDTSSQPLDRSLRPNPDGTIAEEITFSWRRVEVKTDVREPVPPPAFRLY